MLNSKKGFKHSPVDYLILFMALIVPGLTIGNFESGFMEIIAVKSIIFIFGYEVIIGELRGEPKRLALLSSAAFVLIFARGILQR